MSEIAQYAYLIVGLVLLSGGADFLIRGAVAIAARLNISPLVVGLTIVALGTSLPELVVCVRAATAGAAGIAIGRNVFEHPKPAGIAAALHAIVHDDASVESALKLV